MSNLLTPLSFSEELKNKLYKRSKYSNNNSIRHAPKTRCIFKPKCDKILRRKLLKYKLRRNGEEDPDVVDVSHILLSTLRIKSPSKLLKSPQFSDCEEFRPKNYLFNMARRKLKVRNEKTDIPQNDKDSSASPITESQEKKQTNAFKLLMDSRNKSIGSNSPGKEAVTDPSELQELLEKKKLKAKRNLVLQTLADAKGAVQRKELEELKEVTIKQKMDERADRLKNMLVNLKQKTPKKSKILKTRKLTQIKSKKVVEIIDDASNSNDTNDTKKEPKTLQLIDIFKDVIQTNNISPTKKIIAKEDEEFLKKLSPSIKKKENMLCYFKKIEKIGDTPEIEDNNYETETIIKVKMVHKTKNKIKNKKLSLKKEETTIDVLRDHNENDSSILADTVSLNSDAGQLESNNQERKKRKRKENIVDIEPEKSKDTTNSYKTNDERPKRNVKRPVKYMDDIQLSSSDDELHIFTPKKRKHGESKLKHSIKPTPIEVNKPEDETKQKVRPNKKTVDTVKEKVSKKATKLAPIFTPKPQLNPEQLQAKQKFLYSGVPDQIKKIIAYQKNISTEGSNDFPVVVHVQQKCDMFNNTYVKTLPIFPECSYNEDSFIDDSKDIYSKLLAQSETISSFNILTKYKPITALQTIKELYPKFPVYRTFRLLKEKNKGESIEYGTPDLDNSVEIIESLPTDVTNDPNYLNWTDKFKATSTKHLIGNFDGIRELRRWLLSWIENEAKPKNTPTNGSDSSDFYDSDSNSKDYMKSMNNLLILHGPVGSGKTSSVYAVASELAIKVIEVNASSKRTGKMMLQDLQEATQSHKVNRHGLESSQKSQEIVDSPIKSLKKRTGRPKKKVDNSVKNSKHKVEMSSQSSTSQESGRTGMSLILVDDADIVFDQDDGFSSAIAQLTQSSKRPVILVTASLLCPHLNKFVQYGKVINMNPLLPRMLGTWLDILCLADGGICWPGLGAKFLDLFRGDIRKSINSLQFYVTSYSQHCLQGEEATSQSSDCKPSQDEENSNMSWIESEGSDERVSLQSQHNKDVWKFFMSRQLCLGNLDYPKDLFNVWWSIPSLLSLMSDGIKNNKDRKHSKKIEQDKCELKAMANVADTISLSDYYSCKKSDTKYYLASQPWQCFESDSVSENENIEYYTKTKDTTNEVIQELITSSINVAQSCLQCERNTDIDVPGMALQRAKDRIISRHENLTNILSASASLDRRALSLDYWSSCRTICRIEKDKNDTVSKRNNRFCHYLKTMNAVGGNSMFDSLAESLNPKGKEDQL